MKILNLKEKVSSVLYEQKQYEEDCALTIRNRNKLDENKNLLEWYRCLYKEQFSRLEIVQNQKILEIGSGSSPLKKFYPQIITSDVMNLDHLDLVFDCHHIDEVMELEDGGLDVITLTNVLHHLKDPTTFLINAAKKLKPGGRLIATEPYFSFFSTLIYKYIHHEPTNLNPKIPILEDVTGPLSSANIALPYAIFYSKKDWSKSLNTYYDFDVSKFRFFTFISYMATGGISHKIPCPAFLYKVFFKMDQFLVQHWPQMFASFFTIHLVRN